MSVFRDWDVDAVGGFLSDCKDPDLEGAGCCQQWQHDVQFQHAQHSKHIAPQTKWSLNWVKYHDSKRKQQCKWKSKLHSVKHSKCVGYIAYSILYWNFQIGTFLQPLSTNFIKCIFNRLHNSMIRRLYFACSMGWHIHHTHMMQLSKKHYI